MYTKKIYAYILCMKLVVCTKTRADDNEQYIIFYNIIYTHGIVHFPGLMPQSPKWVISERAKWRCCVPTHAYKERPSSVRWRCSIFFLYQWINRDFIVVVNYRETVETFFSAVFISRVQSFDVRATAYSAAQHTTVITSHLLDCPRLPIDAARRQRWR